MAKDAVKRPPTDQEKDICEPHIQGKLKHRICKELQKLSCKNRK